MSRTRRPLHGLESYTNAHGEEVLSRRVGRERTHLERQAAHMYEQGDETWRRLTRQRVDAFLELFLIALVRTENAHRTGFPQPQSVEMLLGTLVQRIIPWVYRHRVRSKYEGRCHCHWNILMNWTMICAIICRPFMRATNGKRSDCISATWSGCGRSGGGRSKKGDSGRSD